MTIRLELEQAISVVETHRDILGNDAVDTAVAALKEKIAAIQKTPVVNQQNMAVLVADLSGFTAMSEMMDAEEVRDTINAILEKLDGAITAWGGQIDQHTGDGIIALFSVVSNFTDCIERAALAALDMQMELTLFNRAAEQTNGNPPINAARSSLNLRMRIGVHAGPVVFGLVGSSAQRTAVGDTVAIAKELEHAAPVGGILVSEAVFDHIQHDFEANPLPPLLLAEMDQYLPVYAVYRERPHALQNVDREIAPDAARFVGRSAKLEQLQLALETAIESHSVQVVTVLGEAGIGKSRLRIEFEKLLTLQPAPIHLFKGTTENEMTETPYAVIRHMLSNFFDIHRRSSPEVAREKLVTGIVGVLAEEDDHALERAHFIGHLLGFGFTDSPYLQNFKHGPRRIQQYAYQDLAKFFTVVSTDRPTVLLLESMENVDEGSLDLLEYLIHACAERPLLIVCLARPSLLTRQPICQLHLSIASRPFQQLNLGPLSPIDSRHLITSALQNIPRSPSRLIDIIAEAAGGNPFLITELVESLSEVGAIIKSGNQWRVQLGKLSDLRGKLTLEWLLDKQLAQFPPIEQAVLYQAAVIGKLFWDTAVIQLIRAQTPSTTAPQINAALKTLEQQELIFRSTTSTFPNTVEYQFRHDALQQAAYAAQPQERCAVSHAQCANWFRSHNDSRWPHLPALIAFHLQQAGKTAEAAAWYGRAAASAQQTYSPETSIRYCRQALQLLPFTDETIARRIQIMAALGNTLRQQSHFDEAVAIFTQLRTLALQHGDSNTAIHAFRELSIMQNFQGNHLAALESAKQAEKAARADNAAKELATALAAQGWTYVYLGDLPQALALGKQALTIGADIQSKREMAYSYALLGLTARIKRQFDQAKSAIQQAQTLFQEINDMLWAGIMEHDLGLIALAQNECEAATTHLKNSVQMARDIGDSYGMMRSLRALGGAAQRQNLLDQAQAYREQALISAEKCGNIPFTIMTAVELGRHHLDLHDATETAVAQEEHLHRARFWLEHGQKFTAPPLSPPQILNQIELARLLLAEQAPEKALSQLRTTLATASQDKFLQQGALARKICAAAWRQMGVIAAALPPEELPILINGQPYNVSGCFEASYQILSAISYGAETDSARTFFTWAVYELRHGDHQRGETLWKQAHILYNELGMTKEAAAMERFAI